MIEDALLKDWYVEIWAWGKTISNHYYRMQEAYEPNFVVNLLDKYLSKVIISTAAKGGNKNEKKGTTDAYPISVRPPKGLNQNKKQKKKKRNSGSQYQNLRQPPRKKLRREKDSMEGDRVNNKSNEIIDLCSDEDDSEDEKNSDDESQHTIDITSDNDNELENGNNDSCSVGPVSRIYIDCCTSDDDEDEDVSAAVTANKNNKMPKDCGDRDSDAAIDKFNNRSNSDDSDGYYDASDDHHNRDTSKGFKYVRDLESEVQDPILDTDSFQIPILPQSDFSINKNTEEINMRKHGANINKTKTKKNNENESENKNENSPKSSGSKSCRDALSPAPSSSSTSVTSTYSSSLTADRKTDNRNQISNNCDEDVPDNNDNDNVKISDQNCTDYSNIIVRVCSSSDNESGDLRDRLNSSPSPTLIDSRKGKGIEIEIVARREFRMCSSEDQCATVINSGNVHNDMTGGRKDNSTDEYGKGVSNRNKKKKKQKRHEDNQDEKKKIAKEKKSIANSNRLIRDETDNLMNGWTAKEMKRQRKPRWRKAKVGTEWNLKLEREGRGYTVEKRQDSQIQNQSQSQRRGKYQPLEKNFMKATQRISVNDSYLKGKTDDDENIDDDDDDDDDDSSNDGDNESNNNSISRNNIMGYENRKLLKSETSQSNKNMKDQNSSSSDMTVNDDIVTVIVHDGNSISCPFDLTEDSLNTASTSSVTESETCRSELNLNPILSQKSNSSSNSRLNLEIDLMNNKSKSKGKHDLKLPGNKSINSQNTDLIDDYYADDRACVNTDTVNIVDKEIHKLSPISDPTPLYFIDRKGSNRTHFKSNNSSFYNS